MLKFTVGLDIAKSVFQVHAIGAYVVIIRAWRSPQTDTARYNGASTISAMPGGRLQPSRNSVLSCTLHMFIPAPSPRRYLPEHGLRQAHQVGQAPYSQHIHGMPPVCPHRFRLHAQYRCHLLQ